MFLQQVHVITRDGQQAAFEAALCETRQRVFMTPGFRGFAVAQGAEDEAAYQVSVLWETLEELVAFVDTGRFERCWAPVEPFLAAPPRVEHFVERPGLAFTGPGVVTDLAWVTGSRA